MTAPIVSQRLCGKIESSGKALWVENSGLGLLPHFGDWAFIISPIICFRFVSRKCKFLLVLKHKNLNKQLCCLRLIHFTSCHSFLYSLYSFLSWIITSTRIILLPIVAVETILWHSTPCRNERPARKKQFAVSNKIIGALGIIVVIFSWFDCQFLSFHACYKQYEAQSEYILSDPKQIEKSARQTDELVDPEFRRRK